MKPSKKKRIQPPRLPKDLSPCRGAFENLEDEDRLNCFEVSEETVEDIRSEKVEFRQGVFRNVVFKEVSFKGADLEDVEFEGCDFSNTNWRGVSVSRTVFKNCKLVGADFSESWMRDVCFRRCKGRYGNFRFSSWNRVSVSDSDFAQGDFASMELEAVEFIDTEFAGCQFSKTKLADVDLSTCGIEGVGIGMEDLRGGVFSPEQAVLLSGLMGIVVKD